MIEKMHLENHAVLPAKSFMEIQKRQLPNGYEKIMKYGVMRMPALIVNEQVTAMGKVLKPAEIVKILEKVSD